MTATANDVDYVSAPQDYAAVYQKYFPYLVNLVAQLGIDDNNKEDVASEIFLRFMERGSLEKFDPDLCFQYRGQMRPARFKNYLSRAADMYARGHRDKLKKLRRRELQICDVALVGSSGAQEVDRMAGGGSIPTWAGQFGDAHEDHADRILDTMTEESEAATVRAILAKVPPRNGHDRCDLAALYDAVRVQVLAYGEYDIRSLKDKFQVSSTAMHTWIWWLKANLAEIYGVPLPAKRPRRTKRKDEG